MQLMESPFGMMSSGGGLYGLIQSFLNLTLTHQCALITVCVHHARV